jgi:hypothetical protein
MKTLIIKTSGSTQRDSKTVRAYEPGFGLRTADRSMGVSASTTGNIEWGVLKCAAKAFIQFTEPQAEPAEIETRIQLKNVVPGLIWRAELQAKG